MMLKKIVILLIVCLVLPLNLFSQKNDAALLTQNLIQQVLNNQNKKTTTSPKTASKDSLGTIQNPKMPDIPSIQEVSTSDDQHSKKNKASTNNKVKASLKTVSVRIALQNQTHFQGNASISDIKLTVEQKKNGVAFHSTLSLSQIKRITILKWKSSLLDSQSKSYQFLPSSYQIDTTSNTQIKYDHNIEALNKFLVTTDLGKAWFFSYFVDYKKASRWENLKINSSLSTLTEPLPLVVTQIEFLSAKVISQKESPEAQNPPTEQAPIIQKPVAPTNKKVSSKKPAESVKPKKKSTPAKPKKKKTHHKKKTKKKPKKKEAPVKQLTLR